MLYSAALVCALELINGDGAGTLLRAANLPRHVTSARSYGRTIGDVDSTKSSVQRREIGTKLQPFLSCVFRLFCN